MKIKKFTQLNEEYGLDSMTVGELREELKKSDPENGIILKITSSDGTSVSAIVTGVSHIRVDKNRYEFVIKGTKVG